MVRSVLNKILLARRLFDMARENAASKVSLSQSISINLLQDSLEAFLLAVAEQVNAVVTAKTSFDQYLDLIDAKIAPKQLPFRARLIALNKLRVNSKHYGLAPSDAEVMELLVTAREFLEEVTESVFSAPLASISLIDLVNDGEAKDLLRNAEKMLLEANYVQCLFECRKALFVRIESDYDVAPFLDEGNQGILFLLGKKSPRYARTKEYIDEQVKEPTDYIVLDHGEVDIDLMKRGIDPLLFWNVWRLTPSVYRAEKGKAWVQKREFSKLEAEGIKERAEYVLDTCISLLVTADTKAAATKWTNHRKYRVDLKREQVPVFEKASLESSIATTTPIGVKQVHVDYATEGLDGDSIFWHVSHWEDDLRIYGYISEDDVE